MALTVAFWLAQKFAVAIFVGASVSGQQAEPQAAGQDHLPPQKVWLVRVDQAICPERLSKLAEIRSGAGHGFEQHLERMVASTTTALQPVVAAAREMGGTVLEVLWLLPGLAVLAPADRESALRTIPGVADVAESRVRSAHLAGATNGTNHDIDRVQQVHGLFGAGAVLALMDSGLNVNFSGTGLPHPAFAGGGTQPGQPTHRVVSSFGIHTAGQVDDQNGHGTAIAAIALGRDWGIRFPYSSDHGFAPEASVVNYKVTEGSSLFTDDLTTIRALQQIALDRYPMNIGVVNHSFSGDPDPLSQVQIVADTLSFYFDVLLVTSAGNFQPGAPTLPTAFSQANVNGLAVGAVFANNHIVWGGSAFGPLPGDGARFFPDLVACGVGVQSARPNTIQVSLGDTGTSFSAPMVAGTALMLRAANPALSALDVKALLLNSVADISERNPSLDRRHYGLGLLRSDLAADAALAGMILRSALVPNGTFAVFQVPVTQGTRYAATLVWNRSDVTGRNWDDLSLKVYNTDGRLIALSDSPRNVYERVLFEATANGNYTLVAGTPNLTPQPANQPLDITVVMARNDGGGRQPGSYTAVGQGCPGTAPDPSRSVTAPPGAGFGFGVARSRVPFSWTPTRLQQSLPALWFPQPVTFQALAFRRDGVQGAAPTFDVQLEISLGYTARPGGVLSQTFAENPVPGSMITVLSPRTVRFPGSIAPPRDFTQWDYLVPLDQPFTIQCPPGQALLMDLTVAGHSQGSAPFDLWFDAFDDPAVSRVYSTSSTTSLVGGVPESRCLAVSFVGSVFGATPDLQAVGTPQLGGTFSVVLRHAPPHAPAALCHGWSNQVWGGAPLPFDLSGLGAPGCIVQNDWDVLIPTLAGPHGFVALEYLIPNQAVLTGLQFYNQFLVLDPTANLLGLTLSNGASAIVGG